MKTTRDFSQELPKAFLNKMAVLLGDEFDEFLLSLSQPPSIGIRVNTLKISQHAFANITPFKISPIPWCSSGFTIDSSNLEAGFIHPGKHHYHSAGLYYLQEPSAMAAGEILSPLPGEKVLDLAAAPGGKSTHLAALMKNTGLLVANEIHPKRVWDLAENLERCGVTNAVVTNESSQSLAEHLGDFFDRVMLDAPCSGEGMFRKSESARKEWKPESPRSCAIRQSTIIEQAARLVKPGGVMVYTTCTFSTEENEGVITKFLNNHPEFDLKIVEKVQGLLPSKPEWIGLPKEHKISRTMRIWPYRSPGEGHFIALLVKNETFEKSSQNNRIKKNSFKKINKPKETMISRTILDDFARTNLNFSFEDKQIYLDGSYLYCLPEKSHSMYGLKVIHPGWWLGFIQNDRFSPSHALALGIQMDQARHIIPLHLGDQRVSAYLGGESFNNSGKNEWVLLTLDGFPIGWGKRVQNVVKNYYPHGLRHPS
jgi:NOL1/NOP2/sun family putative RNA methylase